MSAPSLAALTMDFEEHYTATFFSAVYHMILLVHSCSADITTKLDLLANLVCYIDTVDITHSAQRFADEDFHLQMSRLQTMHEGGKISSEVYKRKREALLCHVMYCPWVVTVGQSVARALNAWERRLSGEAFLLRHDQTIPASLTPALDIQRLLADWTDLYDLHCQCLATRWKRNVQMLNGRGRVRMPRIEDGIELIRE